MTIAEDIVALLDSKRHLSGRLTEEDIAQLLFGVADGYQQRVNTACRQLVDENKIERLGKGGRDDPYTYQIRPIPRRKL